MPRGDGTARDESDQPPEIIMNDTQETQWGPLWQHMQEAYGLILVDDECNQIARAVDKARLAANVIREDRAMKLSTSSDDEQSPPVVRMPADAPNQSGVVDGADAAGGVDCSASCTALCRSCGKLPAAEPHPCPFQEEIYDNIETLCDCCDECAYECAMDI